MKPAVIIIDMQKDFFRDEPLSKYKEKLVAGVNELLSIARGLDIPVIWVKQEYEQDFSDANLHAKKTNRRIAIRGTGGVEFLEGLNRNTDEAVITKNRYSAFFKTKLEAELKRINIDTLVLCGINTHACIRMTAIDAFQRDIEVIIAKDCVGSWDRRHHDVTYDYFKNNMSIQILSNKEIRKMLEKITG
ncbi:MAG: isochorismatase family cysteine hydrolase [archaeon]|nr:isochorismatase family cysteine hydrolase [archaeon]